MQKGSCDSPQRPLYSTRQIQGYQLREFSLCIQVLRSLMITQTSEIEWFNKRYRGKQRFGASIQICRPKHPLCISTSVWYDRFFKNRKSKCTYIKITFTVQQACSCDFYISTNLKKTCHVTFKRNYTNSPPYLSTFTLRLWISWPKILQH